MDATPRQRLSSSRREAHVTLANSCRVFIGSVGRLVSQRVGLEGQRVGRTVHRQSAGDRGRRAPVTLWTGDVKFRSSAHEESFTCESRGEELTIQSQII